MPEVEGAAALALFGSALRDDFGPESDVDLVVDFDPESHWGLFKFYEMREDLKANFQRDVDLVELEGIINPLRKRNIKSTMRTIYEP